MLILCLVLKISLVTRQIQSNETVYVQSDVGPIIDTLAYNIEQTDNLFEKLRVWWYDNGG